MLNLQAADFFKYIFSIKSQLMRVHTIMVLEFMARFMALMSTCVVTGSTGIDLTLIPRYCPALSKAEWAVVGTTISGFIIPFTSLP